MSLLDLRLLKSSKSEVRVKIVGEFFKVVIFLKENISYDTHVLIHLIMKVCWNDNLDVSLIFFQILKNRAQIRIEPIERQNMSAQIYIHYEFILFRFI